MSNIVKEFESRIMLTESEYFEIVSHFMRLHPNKQFLKNTNIYLDTDDLYLRKNHITFRIRIINDIKCELTIKIKGSNGDDEINDALNLKEVDMILKGHICPDGSVKNFLSIIEGQSSQLGTILECTGTNRTTIDANISIVKVMAILTTTID